MGNVNAKKLRKKARKNQREIDREIRNVARDLKQMEQQEAKLKTQIRTEAQKGNNVRSQFVFFIFSQAKVRTLAKQIVRAQKHAQTLDQTRGRLMDVKMQLSSMVSMQLMTDTMKKMTKMMKKINKQTSHVKMAKVMMNMEKEKMKAEMNQEVMDDILGDYEDEEAEDELVDQILAEIGVLKVGELDSLPTPGVTTSEPTKQPVVMGADGENASEEKPEVDALEERMRRLNNNLPPDDDTPKPE